MLERIEKIVETKYGKIRIKQSIYNGKVVRSKPEFDDCKAIALQQKIGLEEVESEALKNF